MVINVNRKLSIFQALMGQLNSMKDIVDDAKKDKGAKENLLDKENKEKLTKMTDQELKIAGKNAMGIEFIGQFLITMSYEILTTTIPQKWRRSLRTESTESPNFKIKL